MEVQAHIPVALCAIHNFIQCLDPDIFFTPEFQAQCLEEMQLDEVQGDVDEAGVLADGPVTTVGGPHSRTRDMNKVKIKILEKHHPACLMSR